MTDHLNYFEPYQSLEAHHENQLTRALLVVLRCSPMAHQVWLSLIDPSLRLHALGKPTFLTQQRKVLAKPTNDPIKGISVICAADAPESAPMTDSHREHILDGVVRYDDERVIVFETKLDGTPSDRQAREINLNGQPIEFEGNTHPISWRDLLSAFADLADDARGATYGAEQLIIRDFLDFVDRRFPRIGPCSTLGRCKKEPARIRRRLKAIAEEVTGGEVLRDGAALPGEHTAIASVHLYMEAGEAPQIRLSLYPADTLQQARAFYNRPGVPERILELQSRNWTVQPNFHFGFMAKGLSWTHATASTADYIAYWKKNIPTARVLPKSEWPTFWAELIRLGFAQEKDRIQFDVDFTDTARKSASPRPGLACFYAWTLNDAEVLDAKGRLVGEVKARINEVMVALEEAPLS